MNWQAMQAIAETIIALIAVMTVLPRIVLAFKDPRRRRIAWLAFTLVLVLMPVVFIGIGQYKSMHGANGVEVATYLSLALVCALVSFSLTRGTPTRLEIALILGMTAALTVLIAVGVGLAFASEEKQKAAAHSTP